MPYLGGKYGLRTLFPLPVWLKHSSSPAAAPSSASSDTLAEFARVSPGEALQRLHSALAGLTAVPGDPVYALTKHALVGFVRSVAPQLAPLRINAVCPGIADTTMIDAQRESFAAAGFPLLAPKHVAEAMWRTVAGGGTGECWFVQPGREAAPFRFPSLPGPRRGGERVGPPPAL